MLFLSRSVTGRPSESPDPIASPLAVRCPWSKAPQAIAQPRGAPLTQGAGAQILRDRVGCLEVNCVQNQLSAFWGWRPGSSLASAAWGTQDERAGG